MPTKYKILNVIHYVLFVLLIIGLVGVAVYALEGESVMEAICAFVTHFDGKPHTGSRVTAMIDTYELIPISIIVICALLFINKIVYACTVKKYKKNHFIAGTTKAKSERKLFKDEAPATKNVEVDDAKKETEMTVKEKIKKLKNKHSAKASKEAEAVVEAVSKDADKAVAKTLEHVEAKAETTTMGQLDAILKNARR